LPGDLWTAISHDRHPPMSRSWGVPSGGPRPPPAGYAGRSPSIRRRDAAASVPPIKHRPI